MAFHPMHWFRKHQKTFMASMAIMCMFLFVLSFGRGDAIERLLSLVGGGRNRLDPTPVTTLHGSKASLGQLQELRYQREYAQQFMLSSLARGMADFYKEAPATLEKLPEPYGKELQRVLQIQQLLRQMPNAPADQVRELLARDLGTVTRAREAMLKEGKTEAARQLEQLARIIDFQLWARSPNPDSYFGGSLQGESLLDFLVWQKQADRLGINLTDADVRALVNKEAMKDVLTGNPAEDARALREAFGRQYTDVDVARLHEALRQEYRHRLAHEALAGATPGARAFQGSGVAGSDIPSVLTPDQFWEQYKDNRTDIRAALMTVPTEKFLPKVKDTPNEDELKKLFDRYTEVEPAPDRDRPAFKEPRRVRAEWISASADDPYYQNLSAKVARTVDAVTPLLSATSAAADALLTPAGQPAAGAVTVALPLVKDLRLAAEYDDYARAHNDWLRDLRQYDGTRPSDVGLARPEHLAAALALGLGAPGLPATLTIPAAALAASAPREADLARRLATAILAGASTADLAVSPGLSALATQAAALTRPLPPLADVRELLAERGSRRHANEILQSTLRNFVQDLDALSSKPREAAAYVAENAVPVKGITRHEVMAEPRDVYTLDEAPGLKPLVQAHQMTEAQRAMMQQGGQPRPFASLFFTDTQDTYKPGFLQGDAPYLYWKTEDKKAYVPKFDEARPKVEAAWRLQKAKELARARAEELAREAKEGIKEGVTPERHLRKTVAEVLSEIAAREGYEVFKPIGPMARLVPTPSFRAGGEQDYQPYRFPTSQIPYARPDMLDDLMKLQKPGETAVLRDRPEKNFYVASLLNRDEPSPKSFYETYERAAGPGFIRDRLWSRFQREGQQNFLNSLYKQLRTEAGAPLDDYGNYRLDPEVRKKLERRPQGEE